MRVYNETKTQILAQYDLEKGYLKEDTITHHFEEVKEVKEQGHYETIAEYPNGGKEVEWIVDVEGVEYQPAREEVEDIYIYIPYTQKELKQIANNKRISELKQKLSNYDYIGIKIATWRATIEEYSKQIEEMKTWANEINQLEEELKELEQ